MTKGEALRIATDDTATAAPGSLFVFEWCDCIFESGYTVVSLHGSKYGAFKTMTHHANARWLDERRTLLETGGCGLPDPLRYERWRVRPIALLP